MVARKFALPANPFASRQIAIAFAAIFVLCALPHHNQNDFMYVVAPTLFEPQALYQELPFVQAPLSIFLYKSIHYIIPEQIYYFSLRVVSIALTIGVCFFVYQTIKGLAGPQAATAAVILLFICYYVSVIAWEVGNYSLALIFLFGATYLYFAKSHSISNIALVGLVIGLAATAKINYAMFAIAFGLLLGTRHGFLSRRVLVYIVAGLFGSSLLWLYAFSDITAFVFFNLEFHHLVNEFRGRNAAETLSLIADKLLIFLRFMLLPIGMSIFALVRYRKESGARERIEIAALAGFAFFVAVSPGYLVEQYLAPLAVFVCMLASYVPALSLPRGRHPVLYSWGIFGVCIIPLIGIIVASLSIVTNNKSVPIGAERVRENIELIAQRHLTDSNCPRTATSLSAIPLIGTSLAISKLSATGPFVPQLERILRERASEFHKYADIIQEFERNPPTAVLLGYFPNNPEEIRMRRFLSSGQFSKFSVGTLGSHAVMELFVRKACIAN